MSADNTSVMTGMPLAIEVLYNKEGNDNRGSLEYNTIFAFISYFPFYVRLILIRSSEHKKYRAHITLLMYKAEVVTCLNTSTTVVTSITIPHPSFSL